MTNWSLRLPWLHSMPCRKRWEKCQNLSLTTDISVREYQTCVNNGVEAFLAAGRQTHHPDVLERFSEPPALASDVDPGEAMRHKLRTRAGRAIYALRKQVVEPVFGIIRAVMGRSFF
jgi:hypothetical protein